MSKISIVSLGPGDIRYLTQKALEVLDSADIIVGFKGLKLDLFGDKFHALKTLDDLKAVLSRYESDKIAVVVSGDAGFFSFAKNLYEEFKDSISVVVPGVSSFQYAFGLMKKGYEDVHFVSFHGRAYKKRFLLNLLKIYPKIVALLDEKSKTAIEDVKGVDGIKGYLFSDLTGELEKMIDIRDVVDIASLSNRSILYLESDVVKSGAVYFVGAGGGDPDTITIKGFRLLREADVVVYTGSLINTDILDFCREDVIKVDSSTYCLEEIIQLIKRYVEKGKKIVRLHTGDPSIYGAIYEQMIELEKNGIRYEIIPGISSMQLAASRLKVEYTAPNVSQTVVVTRVEGKTPMPKSEDLAKITCNGGTFIFFLSAALPEKIADAFKKNGWDEGTPVAVCYKVGFEDEKIIISDLTHFVEDMKKAGISKHALIIVGKVLDKKNILEYSKLYDREFGHEFRKKGSFDNN